MKKKEWVYRELLHSALEKHEDRLTQCSIAESLGISLSTVNNAIKPLERMGAVEISRMGFRVTDPEKALAYWGSTRDLHNDVVYRTRVEAPVSEIERLMPSEIVYSAYSAFKFKFNEVPADYSEVYVYASSLVELKDRFPERKGPPNLIVLKSDQRLAELSRQCVAPSPQIYVDLWNLKEWYAKDFLRAFERRFKW
jgi:DNA-binding transcriptional ArsR family regulator